MPHAATLAAVGLGEPASGSKSAEDWQALRTETTNYGQSRELRPVGYRSCVDKVRLCSVYGDS